MTTINESQTSLDYDPRMIRSVLGRFATGVTIASTGTIDGQLIGLTVNSFSSVSLDPPLVSWNLRKDSHNLSAFCEASHWAINVLAADQIHLAKNFCGLSADRFAGVSIKLGRGGSPLIEGAIANLECAAWHKIDAGDHLMFLGRIEDIAIEEGAPLLFYGGCFGDWAPRI